MTGMEVPLTVVMALGRVHQSKLVKLAPLTRTGLSVYVLQLNKAFFLFVLRKVRGPQAFKAQ